jgi:hypothetical protein
MLPCMHARGMCIHAVDACYPDFNVNTNARATMQSGSPIALVLFITSTEVPIICTVQSGLDCDL